MSSCRRSGEELDTLARNMRGALRTTGVSINQVAHAIGVSQAAMSNYLSGKRCPDGLTLYRFAVFTKTGEAELFDGIESITCE